MKQPTSSPNPPAEHPPFAAYVGIDWADQKHYWSLRTADGKPQRGELDHTPEAIQVWAAELERRFSGQPVAVALEQARGALIAMLSKYSHLVLFAIHPNTLSHYRQAFTPSRAKSDSHDADLALELVFAHPDKLRRLDPDTVETRQLQFLTEERRRLVNEQSSQSQRLQAWLKQVFPQLLQWFRCPTSVLVRKLLERWPTLQQLQKAPPSKVRRFLERHGWGNAERIQQLLVEIGKAVPASQDAALLKSGSLFLGNSVRALEQIGDSIARLDQAIEQTYREHPDRAIVESLPGAGPALEPRLVAALGTQRARFDSAESLASFVGIAPVTEASGQSRWVHWRWACPKFLRQTFHEWAACSIRVCGWAREHYDQQRKKGKGHHAGVRSVAFKWIRILFRCWRDRVPYCEQTYLSRRPARAPQGEKAAPAAVGFGWKSCAGFSKPSAFSA